MGIGLPFLGEGFLSLSLEERIFLYLYDTIEKKVSTSITCLDFLLASFLSCLGIWIKFLDPLVQLPIGILFCSKEK